MRPVVGPPQYAPAPLQVVTWTCTQSFQFGGGRACQWCGISYSICIPSLKIEGLPVLTTCIWMMFGFSLVTLTFRPLNAVTGHPCHGLPSCQFSASIFRSRLRVKHMDRQTTAVNAVCPCPIEAGIWVNRQKRTRFHISDCFRHRASGLCDSCKFIIEKPHGHYTHHPHDRWAKAGSSLNIISNNQRKIGYFTVDLYAWKVN